MDRFSEGLNPGQAQAVAHDGHCLILAGAGTGKTTTLTRRVGKILDRDPAAKVIMVTFTREAAREMGERIVQWAPGERARQVSIGTFHGLCYRYARTLGLVNRVASPYDQADYALRACGRAGIKLDARGATELIEGAKWQHASGGEIAEEAETALRHYEEILNRAGQADFFDLVSRVVTSIEQGKAAPMPATHILVDEFQDTDSWQLRWVLCHAKAGAQVTVVGDDDQCIYSFRNALGYGGMRQFEKALRPKRIVIDVNYRSRPEIITAANRLIRQNAERMDKLMRPAAKPGGSVAWRSFPTPLEEAAAVARAVSKNPEDWSVLARNNRLLYAIESALMQRGIEYTKRGGKEFWAEPEARHLVALLRAIVRPQQKQGLDNALRWAGVSEAGLDTLSNTRLADFQSKVSTLRGLDKPIIEGLIERYPAWAAQNEKGRINLVVHAVSQWLGTARGRKTRHPILAAATSVLTGLPSDTLARRLDWIVAHSATQKQRNEEQKGVFLLTIHASKGLEFDNVWLVGADDKTIPDENSAVTEERRLFFVAMTRARQQLVVSSTGEATRFITEANLPRKETKAA